MLTTNNSESLLSNSAGAGQSAADWGIGGSV